MTCFKFGDIKMSLDGDEPDIICTVEDENGVRLVTDNIIEAVNAFNSAVETRTTRNAKKYCRDNGRNEFTGVIINGILGSNEN